MIPSKFQEIIYDATTNTIDNIIIKALAGSGKTTTIVEISKKLSGNIIFCAFNKKIAEELKSKVPDHITCSTLHSAGFSLLKSHYGKITVDSNKINHLMDQYVPLSYNKKGKEVAEVTEQRKAVREIISKIKNSGCDFKDQYNIQDIIDLCNLDVKCEDIFNHVQVIMNQSNSNIETIDFDDMIYLPEYFKINAKFKYDNVIVDEAQDLNIPQINLVLKIKKYNGRLFAVGDPRQAIFYFRGSDKNSMTRLQTATNAVEYTLPICYRCKPSHLDKIRYIVPEIKANKVDTGNDIVYINENQFMSEIIKENNPLVICRVNSYMVKFVLELLKNGHKATIIGRNFGEGLIKIVKKFKGYEIQDFYNELSDWRFLEIKKLDTRENKAPQTLYDNIEDKYSVLDNVAHNCNNIEEVIDKLNILFDDDDSDSIRFSTIHKIKGCENDVVYILAPFMLPLQRKNQSPEEAEAELNVKYVAYTRAKEKLVIVNKE